MAKKGRRDTPDEIDPGQVARTFEGEIKKATLLGWRKKVGAIGLEPTDLTDVNRAL